MNFNSVDSLSSSFSQDFPSEIRMLVQLTSPIPTQGSSELLDYCAQCALGNWEVIDKKICKSFILRDDICILLIGKEYSDWITLACEARAFAMRINKLQKNVSDCWRISPTSHGPFFEV
jgi:hypothetical protein